MQGTHDTDGRTTVDGDGLDPREAARLLQRTKRYAKRQFNLSPPWVTALMGAVILFAYGALWLSTRPGSPCSSRSLATPPRLATGLAAGKEAPMGADALDPVIHAPARLRIIATLAALPDGDSLSFTRLQDMLELTPGNLITHLRKLEDASYLTTETTRNGRASRTSIALTAQGRAALDAYTNTLRNLLGGL